MVRRLRPCRPVLGSLRMLSSTSVFLAVSCWTIVRSSARNSLASPTRMEANSDFTDATNSSFWFFIKMRISSHVAISRTNLKSTAERRRITAGRSQTGRQRVALPRKEGGAVSRLIEKDRPSRGSPPMLLSRRCPKGAQPSTHT